MQKKTHYTYIGKLIGVTRRSLLITANDVRFKQENFIFFGARQICQQSRLSRIENGLVNRHYVDELHYLIANLARTPIEYDTVMPIYDNFIQEVLSATQYEFDKLPHLKKQFESTFRVYDDAFYTADINRVLTIHFDLLLNHHLVLLDDIVKMTEWFECYPPEVQLLFLNTAGIVLETFNTDLPLMEWYFSAVDQLDSKEPLAQVLKAYTRLRRSQFLLAQREFSQLSILPLSPYIKFRIARAQQSLAFESQSLTNFDATVEPAIFHDASINPYERSRPFMTLGMMYYMRADWVKSNDWYQKAISINPYIICIADVFIFDNLLRLNEIDTLKRLFELSNSFIHLYPKFTSIKQSFFRSMTEPNHSFDFDELIDHIRKLHAQDPTITIIRRYLMQYIKRNRHYKLLYEYDLAVEETRVFRT